MTEPHYEERALSPEDLELLAAYVDDRLSGTDRGAVEQLLARSARAREVLAAISPGGEEVARGPEAGGQIRPRRLGRWWSVLPLAAAAVLALVFLGDRGPSPTDDLVARVAAVATAPAAFGGWPATRGSTGQQGTARLAARWFDVRVLAATGRDEEARAELARLIQEAGDRPGGEELRVRLDALAAGSEFQAESLAATDAALRAQGATGYEAGLRLAAIRQAALAGDVELARELAEEAEGFADAPELDLPATARGALARISGGDPLSPDEALTMAEVALRSLGP